MATGVKKNGLWDCGMAFDIRVQNVLEKKTVLTDRGVTTGVTKFCMASGGLSWRYLLFPWFCVRSWTSGLYSWRNVVCCVLCTLLYPLALNWSQAWYYILVVEFTLFQIVSLALSGISDIGFHFCFPDPLLHPGLVPYFILRSSCIHGAKFGPDTILYSSC